MFESFVAGLYFTGLTSAAMFRPAMRFVYGTSFAARTISDGLVRSLGARRRRARVAATAQAAPT
jgi:hypothetical protein